MNHTSADAVCRAPGTCRQGPQVAQCDARRCGFRDRTNKLIPETVDGIRAVNAAMQERFTGADTQDQVNQSRPGSPMIFGSGDYRHTIQALRG